MTVKNKKILCSISTRGRYDTTLPLAIESVIMQTRRVDKLVIFDDNDTPRDVRGENIYDHLFYMLNFKGIEFEWLWAKRAGQHHNHEMANNMGYEWVWRVDDDVIAEPNTLENLYKQAKRDVGGVGGSILTPPLLFEGASSTGKIENIDTEPHPQWSTIKKTKEVDHLHCSFLYRAGVHNYNLSLSRVAHREETLFTYGLKQRGYKLFVVPDAVCWHLKAPTGGIRTNQQKEMFDRDEQIFRNTLNFGDKTMVVLDCGMGDHVVFSKVLSDIKNPVVFTCYPEIIPGRPIAEAYAMFGNIDQYNIYRKMDEWNWKDSLESAFRRMYIV